MLDMDIPCRQSIGRAEIGAVTSGIAIGRISAHCHADAGRGCNDAVVGSNAIQPRRQIDLTQAWVEPPPTGIAPSPGTNR